MKEITVLLEMTPSPGESVVAGETEQNGDGVTSPLAVFLPACCCLDNR